MVWIRALCCLMLTAGLLIAPMEVIAAPRGLAVTSPLAGQVFEPGASVGIAWGLMGNWQAGDTVRIEYSSNGGATWLAVPGAGSLAYGQGNYSWNTTGCPDSTQYVVKVTCNGRDTVTASSPVFELRADTTPPVITHTPLTDTGVLNGPFTVSAGVTDSHGISSVRLFHGRNGGAFTSVDVTRDPAIADQFNADIPGPAAFGDTFDYYIQAWDASNNHNSAQFPSFGDDVCTFSVATSATETIEGTIAWSGPGSGNVFRCTKSMALTGIYQHFKLGATPTTLWFYVYESSTSTGPFHRVTQVTIEDVYTIDAVRYSGPLNVALVPGRYYIVGLTASNGGESYRTSIPAAVTSMEFGDWTSGFIPTYVPPSNSEDYTQVDFAFAQGLTTAYVAKMLSISKSMNGMWYQTGETVPIYLGAAGDAWTPGDTIRLEYSIDSGTTWIPIVGAENLPYNTESYAWNTAGYPESANYRLRVVCNSDESVGDAFDADFTVKPDTTGPAVVVTPLTDTCKPTGSRMITLNTSDQFGISSLTCYWRKNGGSFTAIPISVPAYGGTSYCALPSSGVQNDTYEYYFEARDASLNANLTRMPASGYYSFGIVGSLTEQLWATYFDLGNMSVTFTPDGTRTGYSIKTKQIASLPTDPTGGTTLSFSSVYAQRIALPDGKEFPFYGVEQTGVYVNRHGCLSFDKSAYVAGTAATHYMVKQISAFYAPLSLYIPGSVSWKPFDDRLAVTYSNIRTSSVTLGASYQVELFYDGRIRLSYIGTFNTPPCQAIVGLSNGSMPADWVSRDLSASESEPNGTIEVADSVGIASDRTMDFGIQPAASARTARVTLRNTGPGDVIIDKVRLGQFAEDFSDGIAQGWKPGRLSFYPTSTAWHVSDGHYDISGCSAPNTWDDGESLYSGRKYTDFYFEARVKCDAPGDVAGLILRRNEEPDANLKYWTDTKYMFSFDRDANELGGLWALDSTGWSWGSRLDYGRLGSMYLSTDWNTLAVNMVSNRYQCYINGVEVSNLCTINPYPSGEVGLYGVSARTTGAASTTHFDDVFLAPPLGTAEGSLGFRLGTLPALPVVVPAGQSKDFDVIFSPTAAGWGNAALQFVTRASSESSIVVKLSGTDALPAAISAARQRSDDQAVTLQNRVVSAVFADRFYMQEPGRLGALCVLWDGPMPTEGSHVTVYGKLTTNAGERMAVAFSVKAE